MTEKLYLQSIEAGYYQKFNARVTAIDAEHVVLDQTLFYPLGGGQNWDTGIIEGPNGALEVTEVRGRDEVKHKVGEDHQLTVGDEIKGTIDWERRHAHMRMHTAQHLVSGLVYEMFNGTRTVGNQIHSDRSRIDFNPISFDESMLTSLVETANEIISQNLEVTGTVMTRQEVNEIMPPERTNMDLLPTSVRELRVVKIDDGFDLCPCAGTHVRQLGEIGNINILGKKSKGKGTQRVTYDLLDPMIKATAVPGLFIE
jgi:misacylated tRNA(Ala) deacylase